MRDKEMNVIIVDASAVREKRKLRILMLHGIASPFEGGYRVAICRVSHLWPIFVFVEAGERVLGFPLQKDGTDFVMFNCMKHSLGRDGIAAASGDLSQD